MLNLIEIVTTSSLISTKLAVIPSKTKNKAIINNSMSLQKPSLEVAVGAAVMMHLAIAQSFAVLASSEVSALTGKPKYPNKSSTIGA